MAGRANIPRLTAQDRILLHLLEHVAEETAYEVSPEVTPTGLADAVGIEVKHLPQNVRPLIARGLVADRTAHVKGGRQRRKVYRLTAQGRSEAARLRGAILDVPTEVEVRGERRSMVLREAVGAYFRGAPLLDILALLEARGLLTASISPETTAGAAPGDALQHPAVRLALAKAAELEKSYDWAAAAEVYKTAVAHVPREQPAASAALGERLAFARYRAAFQSDSPARFRARMTEAFEAYREAKASYAELGAWGKSRSLRCEAKTLCARFWLATEPSQRKQLLLETRQRTGEALEAFGEAGEGHEFGRTYNDFALSVNRRLILWNRTTSGKILKDGIENGERAIRFLIGAQDPDELARAYTNTANQLWFYGVLVSDDPTDDRLKYIKTAREYWQKARESSDDSAHLALERIFVGDGTDESLAITSRTLQLATSTGDRYLVGCAANGLAYQISWKNVVTENPVEKADLLKRALQYAEESKRQFDTLGVPGTTTGSYNAESHYAEHYSFLAELEVDPPKKIALLEKAVKAAQVEVARARELGDEEMEANSLRETADIFQKMASIETQPEGKRHLLEESLRHAQESIRLWQLGEGGINWWNLGHVRLLSAEAAAGLAALMREPTSVERTLRDAISHMEQGLELWAEEQRLWEKLGDVAGYREIGAKQHATGNLLTRLWEITQDPGDLKRAVRVLENAVLSYGKADMTSRIAECHWRIAQLQDLTGSHQKAADHFRVASESYRAAASRIPRLEELYKDLALYMNAWKEIEGARYHHARGESGTARKFYERAADLHRFTRRWGSFAANYSAWAAIEKAEDLSRNGRSEEAAQAFNEANQLFAKSRPALESAIPGLEDPSQQDMAEELAHATDVRSQYCQTRVVLEEAEILDRAGDHAASSERYGDAADAFEDLTRLVHHPTDRQEIEVMAILSRAHQTLAKAKENATAPLYEEAAALFDRGRDMSPGETGKALSAAQGHYCRALEAGTIFSTTREEDLHTEAVRYLELAADLYRKAGMPSASQFMKANKLLLDAYMYLERANRESNPPVKARLYALTERVLRASADGFETAQRSGEQKEVLSLLARVKEERDFATSLSAILGAPIIAAATTSFPLPTPTYEKPVGLDQFESANVQASLILSGSVVQVGKTFDVEIEMVNAGRGPAQLVKLEELGLDRFDLVRVTGPYPPVEGYVDLKGKRLEPMKTEEVRLVLRPREVGSFRFRPRILYLDERTRYRVHEPEPAEISVTNRIESG